MNGLAKILPENEQVLWFQSLPARNIREETRKEIIYILVVYLIMIGVLIIVTNVVPNGVLEWWQSSGPFSVFILFFFSHNLIEDFLKMRSLKLCFTEEEMKNFEEYNALTNHDIIIKNFDGFIARIKRDHPQDVRFTRDIRFIALPNVQGFRIQGGKGGYNLVVRTNTKSQFPAGVAKKLTVEALAQFLTQLEESHTFHGMIQVKQHLFAKRSERQDLRSVREKIHVLFPNDKSS